VRYPAEHKRRTRARILAAAGRRFRQKGYAAAGVDELMDAAGLTAGGFYAHFPSKRVLLAEVLARSAQDSRRRLFAGLEGLRQPERLAAVVGRYLSRTHRDRPADGCALPALASEVARQGSGPRRALEAQLRGLATSLAAHTRTQGGLSREDRALATLGLLAGGLMLSRAVEDRELSDRILRACRRLAAPARRAARAGPKAGRRGRSGR